MSEIMKSEITSLIEAEKGFLWSHAHRLAKNSEDAEDLYQDTILKAYRGFDGFKSGTNFKAWVGRIMLNTHINNHNKNRRHNSVVYDFSTGELDYLFNNGQDDSFSTPIAGPEKEFFANHINSDLKDALYSLPDEYKTPFALFHLAGQSYEEISNSMDTPLGTVKSRIFRARKHLQDRIRPDRVA